MESDSPIILKVLGAGNRVLQKLGRCFTVFGAAMAIGIVGTSASGSTSNLSSVFNLFRRYIYLSNCLRSMGRQDVHR